MNPRHGTGNRFVRNSNLQICTPGLRIKVRVESNLSRKARRMILLALFRHMKEKFRQFDLWFVDHSDNPFATYMNVMERGTVGSDALNTTNDTEWSGLNLRMIRFQYDMNQKQFAQKLGISRGHLSKIEHAKLPINEKLKASLTRLISQQLPSFRDE